MSRQKDIQINEFQLRTLLNEEQRKGYDYLCNHGVYCTTCEGICTKGIHIIEIHLNPLNDIMIYGSCKVCNGKVTRIIEFGENRVFYEKANQFRKTLQN